MKVFKYSKFMESFLPKDKEKSIDLIVAYLTRKTGIDLNPYSEIFHIQKSDLFLQGQLFVSLKTSKAIRLNWIKDNLRSDIHSIDSWENFEFDKNPEYTLEIKGLSITKVLPKIVQFFQSPKSLIKQSSLEMEIKESSDSEKRLQELRDKQKRARSSNKKEYYGIQIERLEAAIAKDEKRELDSDKIKQEDLEFDVFTAIDLYTKQVARGKSNSLIVTGMSGIGKTQTVKDSLRELGMVPNEHFYFSTGTVTTAGLYDTLFRHRGKLIVFDDCDSVFKDPDSVNMLKGALDTYPVREISKLTKGNTFDSTTMSDEEMEAEVQRNPQKLPNKFEFRGRVIFISNLGEEKFDNALLSRSLHVDVHLNKTQIVERMRSLMKKINPDMEDSLKEEALNYLVYITENFPVKFDLNIRTLIHSINLRAGNEEEITMGGKTEKIWKLLIKKYLVKSKY